MTVLKEYLMRNTRDSGAIVFHFRCTRRDRRRMTDPMRLRVFVEFDVLFEVKKRMGELSNRAIV